VRARSARWLPVSVPPRRAEGDVRRRTHAQNFLVDPSVVARILRHARVQPGELIVEIGAGTGALTLPLLRAGAKVLAVESDPVWARQLSQAVSDACLGDLLTVR